MAKSGTVTKCASKMVSATKSGVRNGPGNKNVVNGGKSTGKPSGPTGPIKGSDRGGV